MSTQFFSKLSQNYIELLKDDEYYDATIEVGEDPNNSDNSFAHIKLPNISSGIFQTILEYIYGGIFSLDGQDTSDFLKALFAADILHLQELVDYLQKYLIENKSEWLEQHFEFTRQISLKSNNLLELQEFCTNLMAQFPDKIFKSFDFTSLSEKSLTSLIKRDDLQMKEIEVWEYVLKWGLAQNPTLIMDPNTWSDDDFKSMENTLQHFLPLIRFFSLSSAEFSQKVHPYKKLLKHQFYEELLNSYLDPNREPIDDILLPRNITVDNIIDSRIINLNIASIISRWIDRTELNYKFSHLRELYFPYQFKLLFRGSRDGFTPSKFHELCDGKSDTVTFVKVKDSEEIIGGYNLLRWGSSLRTYAKTKFSFIFSFKSKDNYKDMIFSNVKNPDKAIWFEDRAGPYLVMI
ncbi:hypothetical protein RclHR1_00890001 [Rhizophagus clarus]|uniref:TLDc domain-containing protein n=1 Tax=Rhizophagus clarus TaxID=94130 RepID=A0A2Z6SD77_9GLOM|nr:hypothetical protein RclHR1_00890001 [Rhizophagus clarus]